MPLVTLPSPGVSDPFPLDQAISERHSVRSFQRRGLTQLMLARLLWSAQGRRDAFYRTVPSAGATYPLDLLVMVSASGVEGIPHGLFKYRPEEHALLKEEEKDQRKALAVAAINQDFIRSAPVVLMVAADLTRIEPRYGSRSWRYIYLEAGHVGQNVSLMAVSLGLGSVMIGAFYDEQVKKILGLENHTEPVYIIPVGYPAD